jgi:hypothetical protein
MTDTTTRARSKLLRVRVFPHELESWRDQAAADDGLDYETMMGREFDSVVNFSQWVRKTLNAATEAERIKKHFAGKERA